MISEELRTKTGLKLNFICGNSLNVEDTEALSSKTSLVVLYYTGSGDYYYFAGEKMLSVLNDREIKYILDTELKDRKMGLLTATQKVVSSYAILAKAMAEKLGVRLESLKSVQVKPITSFYYRASNSFPLNIPVKLFYASPLLFIGLFPVLAWSLLVKYTLYLWGESAASAGRLIWRGLLIIVSALLVIRVGMDYNNIVAAVGAALILFLPLIMIVTAVFKDDISEAACRFFGWEGEE